MVLTFKDGISEFHKLVLSPTYRVGFHIQLCIWPEKGLFPENVQGRRSRSLSGGNVRTAAL